MGIFKRKKAQDETAITAVAPARNEKPEKEGKREDGERLADGERAAQKPAKKKGVFNQIGDVVDVVKGVKSSVDEIYGVWIKPVMDNRAQIKRRWNALVTAISVIFFLLYVPILLFSKIAKGLSLGWDVALYTCIGVYVAAVIVMAAITVASGKSSSTQASERWRKASGIMLFIVRIASLALSITAIIISGSGESSALDVILMVLAIVSIVFTSLSLIFGGAVGFFKWLISPAKIRRTFSFVALEWKQSVDEGSGGQSRSFKRTYNKYRDKVAACLDGYLLPALGKTYIDTVGGDKLTSVLGGVPEEDRNLTEWVVKEVFEYALGCGYAAENPCDGLELEGDLAREKAKRADGEGVMGRFASLFKRRPAPQDGDDDFPDGDSDE